MERSVTAPPGRPGLEPDALARALQQHLRVTLAKRASNASDRDRFLAAAHVIRDRIAERWVETQQLYAKLDVKRAYYLSLEYLMGRLLQNNAVNLRADKALKAALEELGWDGKGLFHVEMDAGLGNGGLGRLAACFLDSLATMGYPAVGYGLRYEYGIFRQLIRDGQQVEEPDHWMRHGNVWEFPRPEYAYPVQFGGRSEGGRWLDSKTVVGVPYDIPVVGYEGETANTLRLWAARASEEFDFEDFSRGDYIAAVEGKVSAENITKVLYPADNVYAGKELRLRQEYFFVSCTLQDILRRFKGKNGRSMDELPAKAAVQLNDTHPALAVPELMRLLVDREGVAWARAWEITREVVSYTNHTLLPEALEKWPLEMFERLLPRHLEIVFDINKQHLERVARHFPGDGAKVMEASLIEEGLGKNIRMGHLAAVGSHAVNGVSRIHSDLLTKRLFPDLHAMDPGRFLNVTNGITPRRWLLGCHPGLAAMVERYAGASWPADLGRIRAFERAADDAGAREHFLEIKRAAKRALAQYLEAHVESSLEPEWIFDVQAKRLHEYKRQLLNLLQIAWRLRGLLDGSRKGDPPRAYLFAAKAAPSYAAAKMVIRLIHSMAAFVEREPRLRKAVQVVFVPDYGVSVAEKLIPAADVSEQISTAGWEASGTGNMKFALNGALTVGTRDGATIEMAEAIGEENVFLFGLSADQVGELTGSGRNHGQEIYAADAEIREAVEFLFGPHLDGGERGRYEALKQGLIARPDAFAHLADLRAYVDAQARVDALWADPDAWAKAAILNVARMGTFSSDRAIQEYAEKIWKIQPASYRVD